MLSDFETARRLDRLVAHTAALARPVASLTPANAAAERARLVDCLERGVMPVPAFTQVRQRVDGAVYRAIDEARSMSRSCWFGSLYEARLDELELDLAILDAWGEPKLVRPLSARRYGCGTEPVRARFGLRGSGMGEGALREPASFGSRAEPPAPFGSCAEPPASTRPLSVVAHRLLAALPSKSAEPAILKPDGDPREGRTVGSFIRSAALGVGRDVEVRVEPRLASLAATGERTVFLADRLFSVREAKRLTAHEVFGHLVVAANARAQPLRLLQIGVAGSFADQEGLALYLEEALGLMCSERLRTLAARVVATVQLYDGASFGETALSLLRDFGFSAPAAISIAERTFRGGGVARDAGYLAGFLRVRAAIAAGTTQVDELRRGRVSLSSLETLRELERSGFVHTPCYRPSLALSRKLTFGGTKADTSPPSEAASLTMFELT
jgi:hypothetical protein